MRRPRVCVLRSAGTNCDKETAFAFEKAGATAEFVHINKIIADKDMLKSYQILALPGGFTYGDDLGAGRIFANELRYKLGDSLRDFITDAKLIIGICNGFQILVKSGILPGNDSFRQDVSLIINDSGKFEDRWVHLKNQKPKSKIQNCVWTRNLPQVIYLPVAHGEGKFITKDKSVLERLKKNGQIVFRYCSSGNRLSAYPDNPNGSVENIAGICDNTGRILGLMPHPERHIDFTQNPRWTSLGKRMQGDGLKIFQNGVEYARKNL